MIASGSGAQPGQDADEAEVEGGQDPEQQTRVAAAAQGPGEHRVKQALVAVGWVVNDGALPPPRVLRDDVIELAVEAALAEAGVDRLEGARRRGRSWRRRGRRRRPERPPRTPPGARHALPGPARPAPGENAPGQAAGWWTGTEPGARSARLPLESPQQDCPDAPGQGGGFYRVPVCEVKGEAGAGAVGRSLEWGVRPRRAASAVSGSS